MWTWGYFDPATLGVRSPEGDSYTLKWSDHDEEYPNANGWTYSGDYPDAVEEIVAKHDFQAAYLESIEQDDSAFGEA